LVAHLQFFQPHKAKRKTTKELPSQRTKTEKIKNNDKNKARTGNKGYVQ